MVFSYLSMESAWEVLEEGVVVDKEKARMGKSGQVG